MGPPTNNWRYEPNIIFYAEIVTELRTLKNKEQKKKNKYYYHCHSKSLVLPLQKYVVIIILCIRHSRLIIGFVTRVTRLMSHVEQELLTVPVHPSSPPGFRGVRFPRSLYFCVMFYRSLCPFFWSLCCLSFDLQLLITTLVCGRTSRNICYYVKKW
jgi:hypothetical protein